MARKREAPVETDAVVATLMGVTASAARRIHELGAEKALAEHVAHVATGAAVRALALLDAGDTLAARFVLRECFDNDDVQDFLRRRARLA